MAYADNISKQFAAGDYHDISGWRECVLHESTPFEIGVVCEGTRSVDYQIGKRSDVNYFCEFRFVKISTFKYKVESQDCQ